MKPTQEMIAAAMPQPEPVAFQWRSRLNGGAWDAWESGRFGTNVLPFMEVQERALYTTPPRDDRDAEIERLRGELERVGQKYDEQDRLYDAKLTKAEEALRKIAGNGDGTGCNPQLMVNIATIALAEIKAGDA